jgi:hypothetical protein
MRVLPASARCDIASAMACAETAVPHPHGQRHAGSETRLDRQEPELPMLRLLSKKEEKIVQSYCTTLKPCLPDGFHTLFLR